MKGLVHGVLPGCLAGVLLVVPASAADTPKPPPPTELIPKTRPTTKSFYGWEILATGEVGGILAAAGVLLPDQPLDTMPATAAFVTGMPLFGLAGPVVHWSHGDFSKGLVSFGGNLTLTFIGGFGGRAISCNETNPVDDCATRGFLTGVVVAAMTAPVIDALVLGWEDVPVDDAFSPSSTRRADRSHKTQISIAPWSNVGHGGLFQVGLSGRF